MAKSLLSLCFIIIFSCNSSKKIIEKRYYDSGELNYEIQKFKKQKHGTTNEYSKNGSLKCIWHYQFNKLQGETTEFHLDGTKSIWVYKEDTLSTRKTFTKENILFQTFNYLNDLRNGNAFQFYDTGEIEISWIFKEDIALEGKMYYKSGELKNDFKYINGVADGISLELYKNGAVKYEWNYSDGELDGITLEYYNSGKLKCEWNYKKGVLDGKSIYYDVACNIINYIYYDNGKFIIQIKPY